MTNGRVNFPSKTFDRRFRYSPLSRRIFGVLVRGTGVLGVLAGLSMLLSHIPAADSSTTISLQSNSTAVNMIVMASGGEQKTRFPHGNAQLDINFDEPQQAGLSSKQVTELVQQVSIAVLKRNMKLVPHTASIILADNFLTYSHRVEDVFPASEVPTVESQTGGFTAGTTVVIPLYKYGNEGALANTLTHELTHVTLNERGISAGLPSWLNEGFAWYNGLAAEKELDANQVTTLCQQLQNQLANAIDRHELLPLELNVSQIIRAKPGYNVEYEDYLAVKFLISSFGLTKFQVFLHGVPSRGAKLSFENTYGMSLSDFEKLFWSTAMSP